MPTACGAIRLKLLGGRARSTGEVRQKLKNRAETEADIELTIAKLRDYGYLMTPTSPKTMPPGAATTKDSGAMRVLRDLRQRRVAPNVAGDAVKQAFESTDETEQIEAYLDRKYRSINLGQLLQDDRKLQSVFRRLRYAGFSAGASVRVLKRYAANAERLEDEPETED